MLASHSECDHIQEFFWDETEGMLLDEEELTKAAIARSLEEEMHPKEDIELQQLLEQFQQQVKGKETCPIVILRKRLLQTCLTAMSEPTFDFLKLPCIHFSGEDAEDLGGPRREFFRLLMRTVSLEFGVFEGDHSSLVFSHNHSVLEKKKPFIAGQFVAWSLLHEGPGIHAINEDAYFLMVQLPSHIKVARAQSAICDEDAAAVAKALFESIGEQDLSETKQKYMSWFLDHGITLHNKSRDDILHQVVKESLYYRYISE